MNYCSSIAAVVMLLGLSAPQAVAGGGEWPGFRGSGDSQAVEDLPLEWSAERHVAWSRELEGYGQSSPVVWDGRAFVTSIKGGSKETLVVTAVAVASGEPIWQKEFPASTTGEATDYVSRGAPTPVVDAQRVYAFFESGDLLALTHEGEEAWTRPLATDYGAIQGNHGLGSSPAQTDDAVIVLVDHAGPSYLAAFDKETGRTLWKQDRPPRVSWSSPVVAPGAAGTEILLSSNGVVQCVSATDGQAIWEVGDLKGNTVASPTVTRESVLIGSGQPGHSLLIRRGGQGDVAATHVAWRGEGVSSSFGSPLIHQGRAYFVNKAGAAFAVSLATGKTLWTERLPDSTWASPVASGERVYFFCKNGATVVIRAGDTFEKLAENQLPCADRVYGVAVANKGFLIRTASRLTCVREAKP